MTAWSIPLVAAMSVALGCAAAAQTAPFTTAQAARGEAVYKTQCASCHGDRLDNGQFAAALKGPAFKAKWAGKGLDELFLLMLTQMPPADPGTLGAAAYADVLAFILAQNGVAPSGGELPPDPEALKALAIPS
jgi:mono/diheme cytochrome c family protein